MNMTELSQASGVGARTIRQYFAKHLLDKPPFRGARTDYDQSHLVRVRAIRRLLHERGMSFNAVRAELRKRTDEELARMVDGAQATAPDAAGESAAGGPWLDAERWEKVALLPGLELSLRADASPAIRRLAFEIAAHYRNG